MQCVILAAGRGTRMRPLTDTLPKPLVTVCGKSLIQYVVEALPPIITEIILVVGYKKENILAHCGDVFCGRSVIYVFQENYSGGTGEALLCTESYISGKFLLIYADDIHGAPALAEAVKHSGAILVAHSEHPEHFGVVLQHDNGTLKSLTEKPKNPMSNIVSTGGFVLSTDIFQNTVPVSKEHREFLVSDMITEYASTHPLTIVMQDKWIPVGRYEDILIAESILKHEKKLD